MSDRSLAAVTIDVDSLRCYREIHGLPPKDDADDPIYTAALPQFLDVMKKIDARATLFVIGRDLQRPAHQQIIREAARDGHEIASHSYHHDYSLSRRSFAEITSDLARCEEAIQEVTGKRPTGFRAPGYNQSETLFDALEALHYQYDSSFFPTPAYFAARASALGLYRLRRRPSQSLLGDVREFAAPRNPFYPARGARHRSARPGESRRPFIELPMSVASTARLPWLGTTLALFPTPVGKALTRSALRTPGPCVLELHAIDFLDADDAADERLCRAQGDLQVPGAKKCRRLEASIRMLARARRVMTLTALAECAQAQ